jgi:iron complex transport system permease protein
MTESTSDFTETPDFFPETHKKKIILVFCGVLLVISGILAITAGTYPISIPDVYLTILQHLGIHGDKPLVYDIIIWEIRIPRVILAALVGAALSISGAVFQGVFRNPLVEPYILGISSGAAAGAGIAIVLGIALLSLQFTAFIFGVFATVLAYSLATRGKETPLVNLILAGIVVNALFTALLSYLKTIAPYSLLQNLTFWLMGGFSSADWDDVGLIGVQIVIFSVILSFLGWQLNLLSMGEDEARSLGLDIRKCKIILLGLATYLTSISVATVGIIAWVGLIIPHIARMTIGPDHRFLLPLSALIGAFFLILCDTLARTIIGSEIPISVITSALSAPYLMYLIRTNRSVFFN